MYDFPLVALYSGGLRASGLSSTTRQQWISSKPNTLLSLMSLRSDSCRRTRPSTLPSERSKIEVKADRQASVQPKPERCLKHLSCTWSDIQIGSHGTYLCTYGNSVQITCNLWHTCAHWTSKMEGRCFFEWQPQNLQRETRKVSQVVSVNLGMLFLRQEVPFNERAYLERWWVRVDLVLQKD